MKAIDLSMITARRAKLDADIARLREQISDLEAKRSELDLAERVFAELALEGDERHQQEPEFDISRASAGQRADTDEPIRNGEDHLYKPDGIPTVPEMILEAIRHANNMGARGLDPTGLRSYIRGRYWPGMPATATGPIAWRMWKRGDLKKERGLYTLP
jgi:hypothetical protein